MPKLDNPKHEAFCFALAKGLKQGEAYSRAGYSPNPSAASRLASSPLIQDRVEELKKEVHHRINTAMATPNEETFGSLAEMGLTMQWVAQSFQEIYNKAIDQGQLAPANTAVQNIQKLIEIETNGVPEEVVDKKNLVDIKDVTAMLKAAKDLTKTDTPPEEEMVDITPDDVSPQDVLQIKQDNGEDE